MKTGWIVLFKRPRYGWRNEVLLPEEVPARKSLEINSSAKRRWSRAMMRNSGTILATVQFDDVHICICVCVCVCVGVRFVFYTAQRYSTHSLVELRWLAKVSDASERAGLFREEMGTFPTKLVGFCTKRQTSPPIPGLAKPGTGLLKEEPLARSTVRSFGRRWMG